MTHLLTLRTARRASALCGLILAMTGSLAFAQTSGPAETSTAPAESSAKDEPPPGACKPIGLTVSGEVVFPLECRDFIERHKAMTQLPPMPPETPRPAAAAEVKPVPSEARPATVETK